MERLNKHFYSVEISYVVCTEQYQTAFISVVSVAGAFGAPVLATPTRCIGSVICIKILVICPKPTLKIAVTLLEISH